MRVRVLVRLKSGVLDPQGSAVEHSLHSLGFAGVRNVRVGKLIELDVDGSAEEALACARSMTETLLRNPVIEDATIEAVETAEAVEGGRAAGKVG
jgi:phosphoribosylformylglycinamidine synthase subunit PurS